LIKVIVKYTIALFTLIFFGLLLFEAVILPLYVGYDNEHYLPDLRGKYRENATRELEMIGFKVELIYKEFSREYPHGTVISMSPRAFTKVKEGRTIKLTVAKKNKDVILTDFTDMSIRNALLELKKLGLELDTITYEYSIQYEKDKITHQIPNSGHTVEQGTPVSFWVSKGEPPDYYKVPDLVNFSLNKAEKLLYSAGLQIGEITYEYQPLLISNTVLEQSLTAGMRVSFPARVDLTVSIDNKDY